MFPFLFRTFLLWNVLRRWTAAWSGRGKNQVWFWSQQEPEVRSSCFWQRHHPDFSEKWGLWESQLMVIACLLACRHCLGCSRPPEAHKRGAVAGCAILEGKVCCLGISWLQLDLNSPGDAVIQQPESCSRLSADWWDLLFPASSPGLRRGEQPAQPARWGIRAQCQPKFCRGCSNQDSLSPKNSRDSPAAEGHTLDLWEAAAPESGHSAVLLETYREQWLSPRNCRRCSYSSLSQELATCLSSN